MRLDHLLSMEIWFKTSAVWFSGIIKDPKGFPVVMRLWETPVPMPNTTVKTQAADDTWWEATWESKWLPESISGCSVAWLARLIWDQEVASSNLVTPILYLNYVQ